LINILDNIPLNYCLSIAINFLNYMLEFFRFSLDFNFPLVNYTPALLVAAIDRSPTLVNNTG